MNIMDGSSHEGDEKSSSMDHLPLEMTTSILTRLPIRSILRCKPVCKTWSSLITSPHFSTMHFNTTSLPDMGNHPSSFILLPNPCKGYLYYDELDHDHEHERGQMVKSSKINLSLPKGLKFHLVGCSSSLLCMSTWNSIYAKIPDAIDCVIYVCNPATGERVRLPDITPSIRLWVRVSSGFGFDPATKKFKVLQIFQWEEKDGSNHDEVHLYTLGSNSWKKITHDLVRLPFGKGAAVFVNGSFHWLVMALSFFDIVSFDLGQEKFGIVPIPRVLLDSQNYDRLKLKLGFGSLGDRLCLTVFRAIDNCYDIWVMKNYNVSESWTKQFVIRRDFVSKVNIDVIVPVCFRNNGELLLLCNSKFMVCYNLESGKVTQLEEDNFRQVFHVFQAFPYVGSLISPNQPAE